MLPPLAAPIIATVGWLLLAHVVNSILVFLTINGTLRKWNEKTRWFAIHTIFNLINVILTLPDTILLLKDPLNTTYTYPSIHPTCLVMSLHLYHVYGFRLNYIDKLHHGVMCALLLLTYVHYYEPKAIGFTNAVLFFVCGLPGGIDYYLMTQVSLGNMDTIQEKSINVFLNTWIRSVGIMYCVFTTYINYIYGYYGNPFVTGAVIIVLAWNAQYFSQLTAIAYGQRLVSLEDMLADTSNDE